MKKITLLSLIAASTLLADGYQIPETSLNAVALSSANVAHSQGADAAYYNPANMVYMKDENTIEVDLMYIGLDKIKYKGTHAATGTYVHNIESKSESFIVPSVHYVSGKAGETRIGLSIVSPGGLSKRWDAQPAKSTAEEFSLQIMEINPTVAVPISDKLSVAFGFRIVHSEGVVKASGTSGTIGAYSQDMAGDSIDYGYNFALSYKPTSDIDFALTYRSKVDLSLDGDADLSVLAVGLNSSYGSKVSVPLPAVATVALAYTFPSKTTIEVLYQKNYWSTYNELDFDYTNPTAETIFGGSKVKDYKDTTNYRVGVTQELDSLTLMGGFVFGESPIPNKSIGFELPDSDSFSVSMGARYSINDKIEVGLSALYSMRESRDVSNTSITGEFSGGNILIVSSGISYKF